MMILQILLSLLALWLISGTIINFSKHPHWYIRGWDFPRMFAAGFAGAIGVVYVIFFHNRWWDWALVAGLAFVIIRQLYLIFPYTPLARKVVKHSAQPWSDDCFRLVISNVLQENREHELWMSVIRTADPDVLVVVEVDSEWEKALEPLKKDYPFNLCHPQNNYYGMCVFSKLEFDGEPELRFIVQDDIPSAHVTFKLRDGQRVMLHALHPRPPEPLRDQDSAPRDAELILVAKEIGKHQREMPTIVCGDLNDVAWSYTTQLFLRISRMLDPRKGRGLYNSFNAKSRIFRFPLDHVFHSDEFKLIDLQVLPYVGSDHFPIMIELSCQPESARQVQPESSPKASDHEQAEEIVEKQAERELEGKEHGHVSERRTHV